jgi:hypothetical protein
MNFKIFAMKTLSQRIALISLLLLASCGTDYTISTRIYADGSCERIMTAKLDSTDYEGKNPFFIPIDSSWTQEVSYSPDTAEDKTIATVTVHKKFASVAKMNDEYHRNKADERPNLLISLKRKFRWFYSIYHYEETYLKHFPFHHFDIKEYYSPEELEVIIYDKADSVLMAGMDSLEIKAYEKELIESEERYFYDNTFEEFYLELTRLDSIAKSGHLTSLGFNNFKDTLKEALVGRFDKNKVKQDNEVTKDTTAAQILAFLDSHFSTRTFTGLMEVDSLAFTKFDEAFSIDLEANQTDSYQHEITLPGMLLETNAQQILEGTPVWDFTLSAYFYSDFTMWAESRKPNNWAFIVTGILVLLMLVFAVFHIRKR